MLGSRTLKFDALETGTESCLVTGEHKRRRSGSFEIAEEMLWVMCWGLWQTCWESRGVEVFPPIEGYLKTQVRCFLLRKSWRRFTSFHRFYGLSSQWCWVNQDQEQTAAWTMPLNMPSCFHHINHQPIRPNWSYVLNPTMMNLHAQWNKSYCSCLGYVGDYTTQLYRYYNKPVERSLLTNQYNGK